MLSKIHLNSTAIMKHVILSMLALTFFAQSANTQEFVQISTGAGYSQQTFYNLENDQTFSVAASAWDLAFSTIGLADAAVHINEGAASGAGALPAVELYLAAETDFAATIDASLLTERLYNDEKSWETGALNLVANPADPFDFGWGSYNPMTHALSGTRIFVIKLRDGNYKKFMIQSLAGGTYTIRYANLDSSSEATATVNKADFPDTDLAFFSFADGGTIATAPAQSWDLSFCRYVTPLDDGTGNILDYAVTGILSGPGVEVAEARGVEPFIVEVDAYVDSFETDLDIIGYDWKAFDFTQGWLIPEDLAYFVKKADDHVWRLVFVDFEGSATGTGTFEKTDLGILTSTSSPLTELTAMSVFPNPAQSNATLAFSMEHATELQISIRDLSGRTLWQSIANAAEGFNVFQLPVANLPQGMYLVNISNGNRSTVSKLMRN